MSQPAGERPSISVVIPVYNSAFTLPNLVERLAAVLPSVTDRYEVLLVEDASRDDSWAAIERLASAYPFLRGIRLTRNYGQHNALLCGLRAARCDITVTLDDDLQNPPEEIPKLLARLAEGYDVVYGTGREERHGLWRGLASRITKLALQTSMGIETARKISAFRALRTQLRDAFAFYQSPFVSIDVLLTWGTTRFSAVDVLHDPRRAGKSNYTFLKLVTHALNMVTGFSTLPLQIASVIGFLFTLFGIGVLAFVLGRYLVQGTSVEGFPFLASIIAIFSGAQLFAIGIIGEYLARIHFRTMNRPAYTVREVTGADEARDG